MAAEEYTSSLRRCRATLPYQSGWGEDLFAQRCMDAAGVRRVEDFDLVVDGNCRGPKYPHCSPGHAAYHPRKQASEWEQCWEQAGGGQRSWRQERGDRRYRGEFEYDEDG